jgi:hypothetical protein
MSLVGMNVIMVFPAPASFDDQLYFSSWDKPIPVQKSVLEDTPFIQFWKFSLVRNHVPVFSVRCRRSASCLEQTSSGESQYKTEVRLSTIMLAETNSSLAHLLFLSDQQLRITQV